MVFTSRQPRQITLLCLLFLALTLSLAGCSRHSDWIEFRGEGGRGVSSSRISPPLGVRWKIKLQDSEIKLESFNPPIVAGNTVYFGSGDGNFYALDLESGYMRWVFRSGAEINSIPYADSRYVYFGSKDGKLYALNRKDGSEAWHFSTESQINSQIRRYRDHVIFVGDRDAIYFLSPEGNEQFRIDNPGWMHFTFNIDDGVMYFATGPQSRIGPFDIMRREFQWWIPFHEINSHWYSVAAMRKNLVYFGTSVSWGIATDIGYYALDRSTGRIVWSQTVEADFSASGWDSNDEYDFFERNVQMLDFMAPVVWRDLVIYTGSDVTARAFHAETGALRWEQSFDAPIASSATIAGGRLYFGLYGLRTPEREISPRFVCLDARTGKRLWSMELEGALLSAPVIAGKRIIFGTDESVFYVLEEVL